MARQSTHSEVFNDTFAAQPARYFSHDSGGGGRSEGGVRRLVSLMVKTEDDLRAEQFAATMLHAFNQVFEDANLPLRLRPYEVVATGPSEGFVEILPDTQTLHGLIERLEAKGQSLVDYFHSCDQLYRERFVASLAAYSLFCYFLQIKDRHNENIMMDRHGQLIHIDFGFMFQSSPGGGSAFGGWEASSFKLSDDFVFIAAGPPGEGSGGASGLCGCLPGQRTADERQRAVDSAGFEKFRQLFAEGFEALHNQAAALSALVSLAGQGNPQWRCWAGDPTHAATLFRERLELDVGTFRRTRLNHCCKGGKLFACCNPPSEAKVIADHLIDAAVDNFGAKCYDRCQKWQNDIMY